MNTRCSECGFCNGHKYNCIIQIRDDIRKNQKLYRFNWFLAGAIAGAVVTILLLETALKITGGH